jgi:hypothetical protein
MSWRWGTVTERDDTIWRGASCGLMNYEDVDSEPGSAWVAESHAMVVAFI